ncbi:MAG: LOW QUALITY PROTEIN: hypothetical protein J3R72DRAFT_444546, partial [Linnemannia gamsii]
MSNKRRPNNSSDEEDPKRHCLEIYRPNPQPQMLSSIDYKMFQMKTQCLVKGRSPHNYIPALGKATLDAPDYSAVPLLSTVTDFLDGKRQVLLLMGDSGSGKTYFLRQLERDLWEQCRDTNGPIPILVRLSSIQKPLSELMDKVLKDKGCNRDEIRAFRDSGRQFILICDEYDEIPATGNIYNRNRFNKDGQWRVKLIIACRSYKLGKDSDDRFKPMPDNTYDQTDLGLFQKAAMAPFTRTMIEAYVEKYVSQPSEPDPRLPPVRDQGAPQLRLEASGVQETQQRREISRLWSFQDYMDALTDLVENPYILSFILRLLPTFNGSTQGVSKSDLSLDMLRRLNSKDMNRDEREAFEEIIDCGFEEYLLALAVAVFKYQEDVSFVEYKPKDPATWKAEFFGTDPKSKLLQESVPLTRSGSSYRFIHTSLLDYLYSLAVSAKGGHGNDLPGTDDSSSDGSDSNNMGLLRKGAGTALGSGSAPHRAQGTQRRSAEGLGQQTYEQGQSQELELALEQAKSACKLGITNIAERSMAVQNSPEFKDILIKWSRTNKTHDETLAANAMTILVSSDLRGDFDSADLQGSDLRDVIFDKLEEAQLTGASNTPTSSAYSRDGRNFAVAFEQRSIRVYNTANWDLVTSVDLAFSPVGGQLAFGDMDGRLRTWMFNETLMTPVLCDDHTDFYSPDGQLVATACQDGIARILDASSGQCVKKLSGHLGGVSSLLVSGGSDNTIRLWDPIRTLEGHENAISKVLFSPNEIHIASSSFDRTGDCETTLRGHSESVISVAYSPCGNRLVSSSEDGTIRIGSAGPIFRGHTDHVVSVAYSPDGKQDMELRLWDCRAATKGAVMFGRTNAATSGMYPYSTVKRYGNDGYKTIHPTLLRRWVDVFFDSFPVSPDASRNVVNGHTKNLIASGSSDKTTRVWNAHSGALGHNGDVTSIAFSSADGTVRLWNLATGEALNVFGSKAGADIIKWIASGGEDGDVRIWDAGTPHVNGHGGVIKCIVFSPDNIHIASGSDNGTISIWNMDTKNTEYIIRHDGAVNYNIASGGDDQIWNAETGVIDSTLDHRSNVLNLCYSADANYKAYAWSKVPFSENCREVVWSPGGKDVQLWNMDSGALKSVLKGHKKDIESVSRDGMTGECLASLKGHAGEAAKIMFSPNGLQIATCGGMKSESPSEPGRLSSKTSDQSKQQTQNLNIVATELVSYDFNAVTSPVFSPDGKEVSVGTADDVVLRYATQSGEALAPLSGYAGIVT